MRRLIAITKWGCPDPFRDLYDKVLSYIPKDLSSNDTLVLEGGQDIGTFLYKEPQGKFTSSANVVRDRIEHDALTQFVEIGAATIAICRGAQLATAFVGGTLIQHVTGHERNHGHPIVTNEGVNLWASSLHHQMMFPFNLPKDSYKMLAWSPKPFSRIYLNGEDDDFILPSDFVEPEIVFYPKIKTLAIQGHPEYMDKKSRFVQHCRNLVKEYLICKQ